MTTAASDRAPNRLIHETSPYLLQHAHNPVDWRAWGEEAIGKARAENKPIFLSIGYSSCHWCHVMERESFEDEEIARILNDHYVAIKVDREERPDLDDLYMQSVLMMNQGNGGWPMSVFLTPELKPFFGGTYFPPHDGPRGYGFARILLTLAQMWREQPDQVAESSRQIAEALREEETALRIAGDRAVTREMVSYATRELERRYDPTFGGFGSAPKFPPSMAINLLMRESARRGEPRLLEMAEKTLEKMALGGMHDQLWGGFHRYSVDRLWLVPHFEKMLYDNALLAQAYLDAFRLTGKPLYARVGRQILDYVARDMTDPLGGFYSAEDADSEGEEGKYYVWSQQEIHEALGEEEAHLFCDFYGVTAAGNFEGHNILCVGRPFEEFAKSRGMETEALIARIDAARAKLEAVRDKRIHPFKDTKVIAAWNGMMISAMAIGAQATGEEGYRRAAQRAARFILDRMRDKEGLLLRTWGKADGGEGQAKIRAFIEDYAYVVTALVDLYETDFDPAWLEAATDLAEKMIARFFDREKGGFFTSDGQDALLLIRRKDSYDGATPSGNSQGTFALLRLAGLLDRADFREIATKTFAAMQPYLTRAPGAVHQLLNAAEFALDKPMEIAVIGDPAAPETQALLRTIWTRYLPSRVLVGAKEEDVDKGFNAKIAPLRGKTMLGGKPAAHVCENYACQRPVATAEELAALLG